MSKRALWWLASAAGAVALLGLAAWRPAATDIRICLFRATLDLPCPGCGLTRSFSLLARGEFAAAFALHPLAPLLALELAAGWGLIGLAAHGVSSGEGLRRLRLDRWILLTGLVLVALWMGRLAVGDLAAVR